MDFADITVSTQTFTVRSNIRIKLDSFYDQLQPMDADVDRKGQREAAILCVKYQQHKKGCDPENDLKTKRKRKIKKDTVPKRNFLNCITVIIQIEKRINVKIFKNGVFQLTGCKEINNVRRCLKLILTELSKANITCASEQNPCFTFEEGSDDFIIYIKEKLVNIVTE